MLPDWAAVLHALEEIETGDGSVGEILSAWIVGAVACYRDVVPDLSVVSLGAIERPEARLLAVPARINTLAAALGPTYWQTLIKGPPTVVVAKAVPHRIRNVRHQVVLVDVDAWRAWARRHRDPSSLTNEELRAIVEKIERLEEEKQTIADDVGDVYAEAKANGFDTKIMRQIIRIRKMKPGEYEEMQEMIALYEAMLGMGYGRVEHG